MKKAFCHFTWILLVAALLSLCGCRETQNETTEGLLLTEEPDYADKDNWYICSLSGNEGTTDVFYILPTCIWDWKDSEGNTHHFSDVKNEEQRQAMLPSLELAADIFARNSTFYSPYYRQISLESWIEGEECIEERFPYAMNDVRNAFNHYLQHYNRQRPFILAGFSQGAKAVVELLKEMPDEVYSRMIAAYAIGYRVSREEMLKYDKIRAAADSADTGVTICYNSVASAEAICPVLSPSELCINPVNWKNDNTPAWLNDSVRVVKDTLNNVLIVSGLNPMNYYSSQLKDLFRIGNYHLQELEFYKEHLKSNVRTRINALR